MKMAFVVKEREQKLLGMRWKLIRNPSVRPQQVYSPLMGTENGERVLVDAGTDIIENLPSTDDSLTNLDGFEDVILDYDSTENAMDIDSQFVPTSGSRSTQNSHQR